MEDVVTTPERRADYERRRLWDDRTLAGSGRGARGRAARRRSPSSTTRAGAGVRYAELAADAVATGGSRARGGRAAPATSCRSSCPNWYETVVVAVAIQVVGAVINPLLPELPRVASSSTCSRRRGPRAVFTPAEYRGFDHRDLVAEVAAETGVEPHHVVLGPVRADPRRAARGPPAVGGSVATALEAGAPADAVSELIFTSGTESTPKAIMHTEQTTNFSVRVARRDLGVSVEDVVWMPSPVGHSTGFNYGLRFALYHGLPARAPGPVGPGRGRRPGRGANGCRTRSPRPRSSRTWSRSRRRRGARLDSLRCFGCGGAPVPPALVDRGRPAGDPGAAALRLDRGARRHLEPAGHAARAAHGHRRDRHVRRRASRSAATTGRRAAPGETGEIFVRGPNTCVGFFADPRAHAARRSTPTGGCAAATSSRSTGATAYAHRGRPEEGDHHPRRHQHRAARDRGAASWPGPRSSGRPSSASPTNGSASGPARASCCAPARRSSFEDDGRPAPTRPGSPPTSCRSSSEILDALPTTASGKIQKFEIVARARRRRRGGMSRGARLVRAANRSSSSATGSGASASSPRSSGSTVPTR